MAGTKIGGIKAAQTNKKRYGEDWYIKLGALGGSKTGIKGFALMEPSLRREYGRKGGLISKKVKTTGVDK